MTVMFKPACVLVTGGAGFIGANFIRWLLQTDTAVRVVNLDLLTYAGNLESLIDVIERHGARGDGRYFFVQGDILDLDGARALLRGERKESLASGQGERLIPAPDAVIHMAAESHVDRSIMGPATFVSTNVQGTLTMLEACRAERGAGDAFRFVHVSTDEVYGSLGPQDPPFTEATPLAPNSPYSASKAGSDLLVRAYVETFDLPALITRSSNNYGPYQFPEKLIPLIITRALSDQPLPVYGDGLNVRDWLYVTDHVAAIWAVLTHGRPGGVYNVGGNAECTNLHVVRTVLRELGKPDSLIRFVRDRPGHDRRYAMATEKVSRDVGWAPTYSFDVGLRSTVRWYVEHPEWWERVLNEAYRATNAFYLSTT
jgi:dTDP-glucose 4,6-dehydratase